jgi:putative ABC transport system substrate-binding protein
MRDEPVRYQPTMEAALRRRAFVMGGLAAAACAPAVRAQKALPVVGFLHSRGEDDAAHIAAAFRRGLRDGGFIDGQNVKIEYRWARGRFDQLPGLADDLIRMGVAVIAAGGGEPTVMAVHKATSSTPIVFAMSGDPVKLGLADSINRPGRNVTGVNTVTATLEPKRFGLLHDLVPAATTVAMLVNQGFPPAELQGEDVRKAARAIGIQVLVLRAANEREIEAAFETVAKERIRALSVASSPFFDTVRKMIVALAARYAVPTMYHFREYASDGGLISYGADIVDSTRHVGLYVSEVLKGTRPGDLPILQPTKFDLVINLRTAKVLGLAIPSGVLAIADDVIE